MQDTDTRTVCKLASLDDWELEHGGQDLRGMTLMAADGAPIGRIDEMLVNLDQERVAALRLEDDRVIDIDYVDIRDGKPVLLVSGASLMPPPKGFDRDNMTTEHIPIVEERLEIGKREVELGKVHVRKRVVEDRVGEDVALREERVRIDRSDLNQQISGADADTLFKDRTIDVTETAEEVVVAKTAFVTGEVTVAKDIDTRVERVDETVRRTEVEIDREPTRR